jgi:predicted Fe-Mo cluster-binding NifX family protein
MKLAVTSQNFRTVTGHAGMTRRFLVYQASGAGEVAELERLDLPKDMAFHGFAGERHPIDGVDVLITAGAGEGFHRKMAARGIRVVVTGQPDPVQAVREVLEGRTTPPAPHEHEHGHEGGCGCGGAH